MKADPRAPRPGSSDGVANAVGGRDLETEIDELERQSLDDLRVRWRNLWGRHAPAHLSRALLARVMAYRLQAQAFGDLDRPTARALERWSAPKRRERGDGRAAFAAGAESVGTFPASQRRAHEPLVLKPGTQLAREWQGRMETATVVADGFAWNGETYRSLSAVAQAITGTKWNGHRFFGVGPQERSIRNPKAAGGGAVTLVEPAVATSDPPRRREGDGNFRTIGSGAFGERPLKGTSIAQRTVGDTP